MNVPPVTTDAIYETAKTAIGDIVQRIEFYSPDLKLCPAGTKHDLMPSRKILKLFVR